MNEPFYFKISVFWKRKQISIHRCMFTMKEQKESPIELFRMTGNFINISPLKNLLS